MNGWTRRGKLLAAAISTTVVSSLVFGLVSTTSSATAGTAAAGTKAVASTTATRFTKVPVTGKFGSGGTFSGLLDVTKFASTTSGIKAVGTLSGTLRNASGAVVGKVLNDPVRLPLTGSSGTCQILHLELGPLDLNLLGLVVHINRIVIDITAHSGPGNLLGNLLCALAHLLDRTFPGINTVLANLLTAVVKTTTALRLIA